MGNLFSLDSPYSKLMTKLFDACLLNLLWLLCSIPIFTIGPATQAMYYVALKDAEGEDGYVIRRYFKAFRRCFWQSAAIGFIALGSGAFLLVDIYLSHIARTTFFRWLLLLFLILLFCWACTLVYVFAVQARFNNTVKGTFRFSAGLALKHFPQTIIMLGTSLILIGLVRFVPVLLLIDIGLIPVINAKLLLKSFAPYLPSVEITGTVSDESTLPHADEEVDGSSS